MTHIEKLHLEAINNSKFEAPYSPIPQIAENEAAKKSAEITEQISCEFVEWCRDNTVVDLACGEWFLEDIRMTTKQLFQEYLKSKENDKTKCTNQLNT